MIKVIQDESTNQDEPEDTPFSQTPVKAIIVIINTKTKAGLSLYEYAIETSNKEL